MMPLANMARLRRFFMNQDVKEQLAAFASHFTLNLSLFAILFVASLLLPTEEFAHLSLANGYVMIIAMLLDFGLNSAALKLSIENQQREFVYINLVLKAGLFIVCLLVLAVTVATVGPTREIIVLGCASGLAFWYATRTVEQYDRRFMRYAALNLGLALSRLLFGGMSLVSKSWMIIAVALHVGALMPLCMSTVVKLFRQWHVVQEKVQRDLLQVLLRLAPPFFVFTALYSAIPVITQTAIYVRGDTAGTAAFGIVVLLVGPIALLTGTLRIYLQPQIIAKNLRDVDVFGLGAGSLHIVVAAYAGLLLLGLVPASFLVGWFYADRYPQAGTFLLIYGATSCVVDALGFYNLRVMRRGLVWVGLCVNVLRAVLVAIPFVLPQFTVLGIVCWSAAVLLAGEILLFYLLSVDDHGQEMVSASISKQPGNTE